jgi:anaphase-promoting complex subunit 8
MGHENIEMKNSNATEKLLVLNPLNIFFYSLVAQDFPPALEMNMRDFRAWLGQAYEILKMPLYSLYYYRMAQSLKPDDSPLAPLFGETLECPPPQIYIESRLIHAPDLGFHRIHKTSTY